MDQPGRMGTVSRKRAAAAAFRSNNSSVSRRRNRVTQMSASSAAAAVAAVSASILIASRGCPLMYDVDALSPSVRRSVANPGGSMRLLGKSTYQSIANLPTCKYKNNYCTRRRDPFIYARLSPQRRPELALTLSHSNSFSGDDGVGDHNSLHGSATDTSASKGKLLQRLMSAIVNGRKSHHQLMRIAVIATALVVATSLLVSSPARAATEVAAGASGTATAASAEVLAKTSASSSVFHRPLGTLRVLPTKAEIDVSIRLLAASLGGAAVGLERSSSDRPAGVRTMALVSLGAAAFTVCSMYGFLSVAADVSGAKFDPSRMASNVASGVGFIGAGVITNNRKAAGVYDRQSSVNGLTTAAAIWVSAAVGVACGVGLYVVGAAAALSTIAILRFGRVKNTGLGQRVMSIGTKRKKKSASTTSSSSSSTNTTAKGGAAAAPLLNVTSTVSLPGQAGANETVASSDPSLPVVANAKDSAVASYKRSPSTIAGDGVASKLSRDLIPVNSPKVSKKAKGKAFEIAMPSSTQGADKDPTGGGATKVTAKKSSSKSKKKNGRNGDAVAVVDNAKERKSEKLVDPLLEKYLWGENGEDKKKEPATTFEGLPIPSSSKPSSSLGISAEYDEGQEVIGAGSKSKGSGESSSSVSP